MRQGLSNAKRSMTGPLWVTVCVCLAAPLQPTTAAAQEDADAGKEKRLYQIYRNYSSQPTSEQKWSEALSKAKDQTYTIQKGDTLWGISETFFGDPNFWPKIWSLNTSIYNPHEILPSGSVNFQSGSTTEPPTLGLGGPVDPNADPAVNTVTDTASGATSDGAAGSDPASNEAAVGKPKVGQYVDLDLDQIKLPPQSRRISPPSAIPNSVPPYIFYQKPELSAELQLTPINRASGSAPMVVGHFATDTELISSGEVLGTEFGFSSAGEMQDILIKTESLTTGSRVLAVRNLGSLKEAANVLSYAVNGQLQVLEAVNAAEGIFRARVTKAVSRVASGDILIVEEMPSTIPGSGGTMSPVAGQIIGGEFSSERRLFGTYNVVYLNAGSARGLNVGSRIPVYRNPSLRNTKTLIRENPAEIGELQVVRVADGVATAVVVRQIEDIRVGDTTSPGIE